MPSFCVAHSTAPIRRICVSPQCGFASHSDGNPVTEDDVVKKFSLVVDIAKAIWTDV